MSQKMPVLGTIPRSQLTTRRKNGTVERGRSPRKAVDSDLNSESKRELRQSMDSSFFTEIENDPRRTMASTAYQTEYTKDYRTTMASTAYYDKSTRATEVTDRAETEMYTEGVSSGFVARAVFDFSPQNKDELSFSEGDKIMVLEEFSDGWGSGYLLSDPGQKVKAFPMNHLEEI
jgi:hypothetical protein